MKKLEYGNKYVTNTEDIDESKIDQISDEDMKTATLDFLDSMQYYFLDEDLRLPEDWYESIYWKIE